MGTVNYYFNKYSKTYVKVNEDNIVEDEFENDNIFHEFQFFKEMLVNVYDCFRKNTKIANINPEEIFEVVLQFGENEGFALYIDCPFYQNCGYEKYYQDFHKKLDKNELFDIKLVIEDIVDDVIDEEFRNNKFFVEQAVEEILDYYNFLDIELEKFAKDLGLKIYKYPGFYPTYEEIPTYEDVE